MAIKETEKVAMGALRNALQTWLAPQLSTISDRLARVEGELAEIRGEIIGIKGEINGLKSEINGLRSEIRANRSEPAFTNKRLDEALSIRKRLAALEARVAAR